MTTPATVDTTAIASRVMYDLLGRRWVWPAVTTTEYHDLYAGQRVIHLQGRPVISVESVRYEGKTDDLEHNVESGYRIRLANRLGANVCGHPARIAVTYTYGSPPPLGVTAAIEVLAHQLDLAYVGDPACKLPERITSITRQGITMTVLDSAEFLDSGKTGLPQVDAVLRQFNPSQARTPARVFGKATPPPSRTGTRHI